MTSANWRAYRACKICKAVTGKPCKSRSGMIVNGQTDGCETELPEPHVTRPLRSTRGYSALSIAIAAERARRTCAGG